MRAGLESDRTLIYIVSYLLIGMREYFNYKNLPYPYVYIHLGFALSINV